MLVYQRVASGKYRTNYGNSQFFMDKSTMNGHVQYQTVSLPEGKPLSMEFNEA
jgi:hypothetical protein